MTLTPHADLLVFSALGFTTFFAVPSLAIEGYERRKDGNVDFVNCVLFSLREYFAGFLALTFPFLFGSLFVLLVILYPTIMWIQDAMWYCLITGAIGSILLCSLVCCRAALDRIINAPLMINLDI